MPPDRDFDDAFGQSLYINDVCIDRSLSNMYFSDRPYMALRHGIAINSDIDDANYAVWEYGWVYMNIGIHSCGNQYGDA